MLSSFVSISLGPCDRMEYLHDKTDITGSVPMVEAPDCSIFAHRMQIGGQTIVIGLSTASLSAKGQISGSLESQS